ncbi:hypothetical protein LTR85_000220 [Meristemomyces frigidus]|nr:hypothetical protein LTR85_000220 [Meristemomyces frigidus]
MAKEKEIKPHGVKPDKKKSASKETTKIKWHGDQPADNLNESHRDGAVKSVEKIAGEADVLADRRLRGNTPHTSSTDKKDKRPVTSLQLFRDDDGKDCIGTVHTHAEGDYTLRLKGEQGFKKG